MDQILKPWTEEDKIKWRTAQNAKPRIRSYDDDVLRHLNSFTTRHNQHAQIIEYGTLKYDDTIYPLKMIQIGQWNHDKPSIFIQGGTHGYEPSGVAASLQFAQSAQKYTPYFNLLILPCTSPWSYETDNRWNPNARDPNRAFIENSDVLEASLLMDFMEKEYTSSMNKGFFAHFSLHEAHAERDEVLGRKKSKRDGTVFDGVIPIPDGFFLIADAQRNDAATEKAIIEGVKKITQIAAVDNDGKVYGQPIQQEGVIYASIKGSDTLFTTPQYAFTTEVTPESKNIKRPEEIIEAHIAAIEAGLDHLSLSLIRKS